ncbi:MAG: bifunctional riboflavin kinase/FAD synthetase [Acidobacteria bacterium]|nr:bifunctional riboflavin kinase/FAD synthetase [Acidobacteriota bacterium]
MKGGIVLVLRDPLANDEPPRETVLTIGNFDGVHLGHQNILSKVVERAHQLSTPATAMTFDPHPAKVLRPKDAPRLLTTLGQKLELLGRYGVEVALVVPFTHRLRRMAASEFVRRALVDRLAVREVYIGEGFRFGADREGNVELLQSMGAETGFSAHGMPSVQDGAEAVSSTRVRRLVAHGRVDEAGRLLGRVLYADGRVFRGERLGRRLGFPTLNTQLENELFPARGVYITAVFIPSFGRTFPAVTNIGVRPTVYENYSTTVESHLLDFSADVYHEDVRLFFLQRLRDERVFSSPMALVAQIRRDVELARAWFDAHPLSSRELVTP